ncbi:MAG: metallophosphatase family protein [Rhodanobacter sp.]|jgi:diadenosine tetraphosphatase ApaH/serine/threonine PP2A family protein phosphatase|nr:metallophosphatase family protein [Rhodanobacter sp.]
MKIALLSDIHANRQALEACLAHARTQDAQQFALLGDLVNYGADPVAVVEQCMALAERGAIVLQGNHDVLAIAPPARMENLSDLCAPWTHAQLSPAHRAFLSALPLTARRDTALFVHASADNPERWHYITDTTAAERSMRAASQIDPAIRHIFSGHVHIQALYFLTTTAKLMRFVPEPGVPVPVPTHRRWLAVVGAVGQPRDGDPRAAYALFDTDAAQITFHRVPYDHAGAAAASRAAALPSYFADRLEQGR